MHFRPVLCISPSSTHEMSSHQAMCLCVCVCVCRQAFIGSGDYVEAEQDIKRGLVEEPNNADLTALMKKLKVRVPLCVCVCVFVCRCVCACVCVCACASGKSGSVRRCCELGAFTASSTQGPLPPARTPVRALPTVVCLTPVSLLTGSDA